MLLSIVQLLESCIGIIQLCVGIIQSCIGIFWFLITYMSLMTDPQHDSNCMRVIVHSICS